MCDPKSAKMKLGEAPYGTLLQMNRMMVRNAPVGKRSAFSDYTSSDEEEELPPPPTINPEPLHTLQSLMQLKQQLDKAAEPKQRVPEREIPSVSSSFGIDPGLFKMIYNLGYDAGLDKRDPIPPCEVCEERRRKNRIAAAEQRKRQREEQE
jgi:hypothetical protein